ncbi:PfkB family carbohydrate kinase [Pseudoroseicyclus sp. CXY001]|uniref:PfkB family carbohydrate kinase n=1 Tax=Pseudoroseicyclus sp. CXY001 TaxID=3242492 RepID=UPI00358DB932
MRSPDTPPDILCIGAVLWDIIGRSASHMKVGSDVPGRITRLPGGVAMNIAMTLAHFGLRPAVLTAIGRDPAGDELAERAEELGVATGYAYRSPDLPTDIYMACEGANGLVAAIADAHSLEAAGEKILAPLSDGRLGTEAAPWAGPVALDGNLTESLLSRIAASPLFASADLRVAPASPGKAGRLMALVGHPSACLYVNLEEAGILCQSAFDSAAEAAEALVRRGVARALVTHGGAEAAEASAGGLLRLAPPAVLVTRVTGAGDTFMAAHIASERAGMAPEAAFARALRAAATYVSGETPH